MIAHFQIAFGNDPTPPHVLRLLNGGRVVELSGGFDFGTSADLRTLLNASPNVRTVDLNSMGGRVAEAEHVRDLIREHHLATCTRPVLRLRLHDGLHGWQSTLCRTRRQAGVPQIFLPRSDPAARE